MQKTDKKIFCMWRNGKQRMCMLVGTGMGFQLCRECKHRPESIPTDEVANRRSRGPLNAWGLQEKALPVPYVRLS